MYSSMKRRARSFSSGRRAGKVRTLLPLFAGLLLCGFALAAAGRRVATVEKDILRQANPVEVVVASVPIPAGEMFGEGNLAKKSIPSSGTGQRNVPASEFELLVGARAKTPIDPGEPVLWTDVEEPYDTEVFSRTVLPGRRAMTLGVDTTSSFAGLLHPGDRVDLLVERSGTNPADWVRDIPVIAVDRDRNRLARPSEKEETSTVTLMVSPGEGSRIARASGKVHWFLRNPDDNAAEAKAPPARPTISRPVEIWKGGVKVLPGARVEGESRMSRFLPRSRGAVAALFMLLAFPADSSSIASETIRIRPGFQRILERTGVSRLSVGDPEIVEAQPLPRNGGILVVGKKEGETDLVLWEKDSRTVWHVEVGSGKRSIAEDARAFAGAFPGLTVVEAGGSVILTGPVPASQDKKLLEAYANAHPGVHLRVSLPEEKKTLLLYDLKIIEIGRGESEQLGIRWPDAIPVKGTFSVGSGNAGTFVVGTDFEARLNLLMANGKARILSNPRLACESGGEAQFLAGGEIPIVIITPETRTVEWKTYGIILKIHPTMTEGGKIRTQVNAEVSAVDHGSGTSDVPGFLTRRVSTLFSTPPGETVMLSGLVKSEMAKDVAKVPLLGQIPVIGELFTSRNFRENRTELAIFITPVVVSGDASTEAAVWERKAEKEKEHLRFRLRWSRSRQR